MVYMQQQTSLSLKERKARTMTFEAVSSKKRKWEDETEEVESHNSAKEPKLRKASNDHVELQLDTPLPVEWQRCLDIKSGQIHFYNTRTQKRTSDDPRLQKQQQQNPEPNLDLELNLTCEPPKVKSVSNNADADRAKDDDKNCKLYMSDRESAADGNSALSTPNWMSLSLDADRQEMVAGVCMRCHMLVMMCKAAPSCPNCKFVHPPATHCSSSMLKPGGSSLFLCCKD